MFKGLFMKNKLLAASLLSALAVPAFADDADDDQVVNVTVPEVALLDINDNAVSLALPALTEAGTGFLLATDTNAATTTTDFSLSSNVSSATPTPVLRTIDVSVATNAGSLPTGSQLNITGSNAGTSATAVITDEGVTSGQTSIATAIGNLATSSGSIEFKFGADTDVSDGNMIAHTDTNGDGTADEVGITITYTLSDDA